MLQVARKMRPERLQALVSMLVLAGALAACSSTSAKYPSWEPTTSTVPVVTDRKLALADLEASRQLWLKLAWHEYTYVRARQNSNDELEFTFIVVRGKAVVERAFLTSKADPSELGDRMSGRVGRAPRLHWREQGHDIGRHEGGAPALTVDQLYDVCRDHVLSVQQEHLPRLSFHDDGLLQHCGFLTTDCEDCAVASVQTLSAITPKPWQAPADLLCTDRYGLVLAYRAPVTAFGCEICTCMANNASDPNRKLQQEEADEYGQGSGLPNICDIDPAACPARGAAPPDHASWSCHFVLDADGCADSSYLAPNPECLARARPLPMPDPTWRHRCPRHP